MDDEREAGLDAADVVGGLAKVDALVPGRGREDGQPLASPASPRPLDPPAVLPGPGHPGRGLALHEAGQGDLVALPGRHVLRLLRQVGLDCGGAKRKSVKKAAGGGGGGI